MISLVGHNVNSNVKKVTNLLMEESESANANTTRVGFTSGEKSVTSGYKIAPSGLSKILLTSLTSPPVKFGRTCLTFG